MKRITAKEKAYEIIDYFKNQDPNVDYHYIRDVFRQLRIALKVKVTRKAKILPYVPTEEEIKRYYNVVWKARNSMHMLMVKTMLYTGVRIGEFVNIKIIDVDLDSCQIRIPQGKGEKSRIVPFPEQFRETLNIHMENALEKGWTHLFESRQKKKYTDRGVRFIIQNYAREAKMPRELSPHKLRHFLFTWMKKQGIDDALIQPYSGHENRVALEMYSKLTIKDAQSTYNRVIERFPV